MNRTRAFFLLALVASLIVGWQLWPQSKKQSELLASPALISPTDAAPEPESSANSVPHNIAETNLPLAFAAKAAQPANLLLDPHKLRELQGRVLREQLESFWRECVHKQNCEKQLAQLQTSLSVEWFQLLQNFRQRSRQWQDAQANMPLESLDSLSQRIEMFKQNALEIWGPLSTVLLADQFAILEFRLDSVPLTQIEASQFVEQYQSLIERWQQQGDVLEFEDKQTHYERALSLIPSHYSADEREQIRQTLAQKYLSDEQSSEIAFRAQQEREQEKQAEEYQRALAQLKASLEEQRARRYASWGEPQWQNYYQQQIARFRREFFATP
ncbi:chromosome partitioning protein ParA [Vibrio cidicii]|nr:chromosome partitioning protein ParA [Vibrio cidicii]